MNIVLEYIKYRLNAKYLHGVHSPFVYDFMKNAMGIYIKEQHQKEILQCISNVNSNKKEIIVQDYGAKSKKLKGKRSVREIFKTSSSYGKNALLLYRISNYFKPKRILELGTSIGIGSLHLHLGYPSAHITSVEGCQETFNLAKQNLESTNIELINSTFYDYIKSLNEESFDLIFIDGHHDGEALKYYLKLLSDYIHNDTIIVLDDIRWSNSMYNAWNKIKLEKKYHLSMDFFRMGILMKRPQQEKEYFILKLKR
ncbi:MAG: class I SAM-dependent methyltransferase [Crocinitomicaceae bacterium]|nr:class I SAM-dependent methyltransferase [Crocinitomicaceae bacterium]